MKRIVAVEPRPGMLWKRGECSAPPHAKAKGEPLPDSPVAHEPCQAMTSGSPRPLNRGGDGDLSVLTARKQLPTSYGFVCAGSSNRRRSGAHY